MTEPTRVMTGLFPDRDSAERAYQGVIDRGYTKDDVDLVMSDDTRKRHFGSDVSTSVGTTTELGSKADADHLAKHWQDARGADIYR